MTGPSIRMTQTVIMCKLVISPEVMKHYNGRVQAGTPCFNEYIKGHKHIYERLADGGASLLGVPGPFSDQVRPWAVVK